MKTRDFARSFSIEGRIEVIQCVEIFRSIGTRSEKKFKGYLLLEALFREELSERSFIRNKYQS
jgi:hypothetical protein